MPVRCESCHHLTSAYAPACGACGAKLPRQGEPGVIDVLPEPVPLGQPPRSQAERTLPMRCAACSGNRHGECRSRPPACTCATCHGRQTVQAAIRVFKAGNDAQCRTALGVLASMSLQRWTRTEKIKKAGPVYQADCDRCGKPVWSSPYGRPRRYCSPGCKKASYRRRRAERAALSRAAASQRDRMIRLITDVLTSDAAEQAYRNG